MSAQHSIDAEGLLKTYGGTRALDGFDLAVSSGTIHGLLGPNGAGKSTAVRILATLVDLDSGRASVAGYDVRTQADQVRRSIGLVGQSAALDEILGGRQNLVMFGRLYDLSRRAATARAEELLELFGLTDAADRPVATYSGGMRRRLDIAAGLILTPVVLFLDEPTTGLDPRARNEVWAAVRQVAGLGTTVLLTTQYLDEADQLAERIAVMDHGRVVADDTPERLKAQVSGDRVVVRLPHDAELREVAALLSRGVGAPSVDDDTRTLTFDAPSGPAALLEIGRGLDALGLRPEDISLRRPTLDEVFLTLTGAPAPQPTPLSETKAAR
jgi:ABC-2 type transport system ATP-binding protein